VPVSNKDKLNNTFSAKRLIVDNRRFDNKHFPDDILISC
jgi:hypothetical protein